MQPYTAESPSAAIHSWPKRPGTVVAASVVAIVIGGLIALAGLLMVLLAVVLVVSPDFFSAWPGPAITAGFGLAVLIVFVIGLVTIGFPAVAFGILLIWASSKASKGRNWARVTTTVLLAIGIVLGPAPFLRGDAAGVIALLGLIGPALMVIPLVLFWWPSPNAWYRQMSNHSRSPN